MSIRVGLRLTHGYQINYIGYLCIIIRAFEIFLKLIRSQYLKTEKFHITKEANWDFFLNRLSNGVPNSQKPNPLAKTQPVGLITYWSITVHIGILGDEAMLTFELNIYSESQLVTFDHVLASPCSECLTSPFLS